MAEIPKCNCATCEEGRSMSAEWSVPFNFDSSPRHDLLKDIVTNQTGNRVWRPTDQSGDAEE